jgi:multiple sugar transport system substrate-binding protein
MLKNLIPINHLSTKGKIYLTGVLVVTLALGIYAVKSNAPKPTQAPVQRDFNGKTFRLLVVGDPFAKALKQASVELGKRSGAHLNIELAGYNDVHRLILQNARDEKSNYDVVSFDVVWSGEIAKAKVFAPLRLNLAPGLQADDFLPLAMQQSRLGPDQLGLPIQPHPELLWVRKDLLAQAGLAAPVTTEDLLKVAHKLTHPGNGIYGLCWNGQRGQALGQQMAHFYGAFGQPLLDESGRPTLDTPSARAAASFAKSLLAVSPPDVLNMAWDQRTRSFAKGSCAMTYEWAARSYLAEHDPASVVAGKVSYLPAPHAPGESTATPLGTWSLGVPANLGARHDDAEQFLFWLSEPAQQLLLAQNGNGGMPRLSLLNDPQLGSIYPTFSVVARLSQANALSDSMRPAVPQWATLAEMMGTVFHDMLSGQLTAEAATALAQARALQLFALPEKP